MIFKIGDKILFKKEKQEGIVLEILSKEKILIRNSNGFDIEVFSNDIILFKEIPIHFAIWYQSSS